MKAIELRVARDIIIPLLLIVLYLFMPFRLVQAILLFFVLSRALALLLSFLESRSIRVSRMDAVVYAHARSKFLVRLELINRSLLPIGPVIVHDTTGNFATDQLPTRLVIPGSGEHMRVTYRASGPERGEHVIGPVILYGADPLGYYEWERRVEENLRAIIYPAVRRVTHAEVDGLPAGNLPVSNRLYEDVTQFRSVREYTPGDELKRINWKVTARMGTLYAMEYVPTVYFPVMIAVNLTSGDYPVSERTTLVERAIETAASLVFFFVRLKQEVGMLTTGRLPEDETETGGTHAPIRAGDGHAVSMLEDLARITPNNYRSDFPLRLEQEAFPTGTRLVVVTPPPGESQRDGLAALRRRGYRTRLFIVGSASIPRDRMLVPGLESIAVMGREDELVRE
jgi:uncharacterized protein (DUF58 family)